MEEEIKKEEEKRVIEDEIFVVEKDGKEEIVKTDILEENKPASPSQIKKEKKMFKTIIIAMFAFVLMFIAFYYFVNNSNKFDYKGVRLEAIKVGELLLYDTFIPVQFNNSISDYHFYLRTNPNKIKSVNFNGEIRFNENMVINFTDNFNCEDDVIAVANFLKLQEIIGTKVIMDENATCDDSGRYGFVRLLYGNETKITEYGVSGGCYDIEVNNCETLMATEKFMLETFVKLKE